MDWIDLIKKSVKNYYFHTYETEFSDKYYNCTTKNRKEFLISSDPYFTIHIVDRLGGTDARDWSNKLKEIYTKIFGCLEKVPTSMFSKACKEIGKHKFIRHRKNKRQTSLCEVYITWERNFDIEVLQEDIELKSTTASGPGGQNKDKGNSKSQIIYKPLGIVLQEEQSRNLSYNHQKNIIKLKSMVIDRMKKDLGEGILKTDNIVRIYEFNNKLYIPAQPSLKVEDVIKKNIN